MAVGDQFLLRLLRRNELLIRRRKKYATTTDSRHWLKKHPNLAAELKVDRAEQLGVGDITYISTGSKFGYLVLITDAYSRKIVGHEFSKSLNASFVSMHSK
ncbi:MAG: hypothetical protein IPH31_25685 [Lewinellaceae bacterium]|nr:hypothetical protein [Lewinellaceae bacterium]